MNDENTQFKSPLKTLKDYQATPLNAPEPVGGFEMGDSYQNRSNVSQEYDPVIPSIRGTTSRMKNEATQTGEANDPHPFKFIDVEGVGWELYTLSTIIDEEDGTSLFITGLDTTERTTTGDVYVDVTITSGSFASAEIVVGTFTSEVVTVSGEQTKAQLFLGRVAGSVEAGFTFKQAWDDSAILTYIFHNGIIARAFASHPTNRAELV